MWLEALARVRASQDVETRLEAAEVFVAESGRCRLVDRVGEARVRLRGGHHLEGVLGREPCVADHLVVEGAWWSLVPVAAVLSLTGSRPGLRSEAPERERTVASVLREMWQEGVYVRALGSEGGSIAGPLHFVGADHVDLRTSSGTLSLPMRSVSAWLRA